jgi:plastocyanin
MRSRELRLTTLAAALIATAACGGGSSGGAPTPPTPAPGPITITITRQNGAQSFSPNPAQVGGQMVVFRNADSIAHRVRLNDLSVDTGDIAPGATSRAVQMPAVGTFYHCQLHPEMVGAVNAASGAPAPPCEGPYCDGSGGIY